jgi:hypothetical protein
MSLLVCFTENDWVKDASLNCLCLPAYGMPVMVPVTTKCSSDGKQHELVQPFPEPCTLYSPVPLELAVPFNADLKSMPPASGPGDLSVRVAEL